MHHVTDEIIETYAINSETAEGASKRVSYTSMSNKYAAIADRNIAQKLHLCAVVETWHDSANNPQLIARASHGYSLVEKARLREGPDTVNLRTTQVGICLFHIATLESREVQLPRYKTLEALAVYISGAQ